METQNTGIDYSLGKSNFDPETGIHFGVIHQNEVLQAWADSSEPEYGEITQECPNCKNIFTSEESNCSCPKCGEDFNCERNDDIEPAGYTLNDDEYKAFSDDTGDIMIIKSPYYTYAQFCSPCAPGAGYLMNPVENGVKSYCVGHDWFEDGKAPYPVYSVATGELVTADK